MSIYYYRQMIDEVLSTSQRALSCQEIADEIISKFGIYRTKRQIYDCIRHTPMRDYIFDTIGDNPTKYKLYV